MNVGLDSKLEGLGLGFDRVWGLGFSTTGLRVQGEVLE